MNDLIQKLFRFFYGTCIHEWVLMDDEEDVGANGAPTIKRCMKCEETRYNPIGYR